MSRRGAITLGLLAAAVVLLLLLATSGTVGMTWDEPIYSGAAENAMHWFGALLRGGVGAAFQQTAFGIGWGLVNGHPPLARVLNGFGDRRQTTFNDVIPENEIQLEWARTKPEIAQLERDGVLLGALYASK